MSYFEERVLKDKVRSVNLSEDYIKTNLKKAYKVALKDIDKDINSLYEKLAKKDNISINNAMDKLSKKEKLKELDRLSKSVLEERKTFEDIKDGLDESLRLDLERNLKFMEKNLRTLSKTGYISHLELLKTNIENRVLKLSNENQINIYEHLKEQYMDGYFSGVFNITKELGFSYSFASPDQRGIKRLITSDWKGSNYSKRLYKNTQILAKELKDVVTTSLIRGESIDKMSRNLVARTEVSSYRARTLVRTEAAYIHEMSTYDAYKESGIEKYRYLATLDRRTSKICQELDGKVFEIDKKEIGVNYPPMHPNCRSTTIAYIEGMKVQRLARGSAGKNYEVPADMTYKQWHDNLSENEKGKMKLLNKKDRNATKDKAEYDKYKQVLGKDMPSLARFKDLKYNEDREYELIKEFKIAVDKEEINVLVGFDTYKKVDMQLKGLVGLKTNTGLEIKGHREHTIARFIGQIAIDEPTERKGERRGVDIDGVKEAILNGKKGKEQLNEKGERSILFLGKRCGVSINPDTQEIVQLNPLSSRRKDVKD